MSSTDFSVLNKNLLIQFLKNIWGESYYYPIIPIENWNINCTKSTQQETVKSGVWTQTCTCFQLFCSQSTFKCHLLAAGLTGRGRYVTGVKHIVWLGLNSSICFLAFKYNNTNLLTILPSALHFIRYLGKCLITSCSWTVQKA